MGLLLRHTNSFHQDHLRAADQIPEKDLTGRIYTLREAQGLYGVGCFTLTAIPLFTTDFAAGFGQGCFAPRERIDMWSLKGFGFSVGNSNYAVMHQVPTLKL